MSKKEACWRTADFCCSVMEFAGLPVRVARVLTGKDRRFLNQEKLIGPLWRPLRIPLLFGNTEEIRHLFRRTVL